MTTLIPLKIVLEAANKAAASNNPDFSQFEIFANCLAESIHILEESTQLTEVRQHQDGLSDK